MVLRLALAQKVGLGTPEHALVATALPLVDGGPRRLVHGVLGTLLRKGVPPMDAPRLPEQVEQRWRRRGAMTSLRRRAAQIANRPPLDLSFADEAAAQAYAEARRRLAGAAPRPPGRAGSVADLPGFGEGDWWVQDLAASLPARLIPAGRGRRARPLRGAGRQDHAARRGRPSGDGGRSVRKSSGSDCARISSGPA